MFIRRDGSLGHTLVVERRSDQLPRLEAGTSVQSRYVAYYRVSTKAQGNSGLGLEAQRQAVSNFIPERVGELIASYTDIETGTRKGNDRPHLAAALKHCKRERATLVIAKLDRLSRNVYFVSGLMESGVDFVAVDMPSANRLTIHILAAVAEEEARMISRRTKEALAAAKMRGVKLGRPENLTPEARAKGLRSVKENAKMGCAHLLPMIRELRERGCTYWQIAEALNARGEATRMGYPFNHTAVIRMLRRSEFVE
jgi:DNA invertase Pin-like site-specific DNA recombinase